MPTSSGPIPSAPWADPAGGGCVAAPGASQRDVDQEDTPEYPWSHTAGQGITVYFETGALPPRYAGFVETAAGIWSQSPCVEAIAIDRCPAGAACSTVAVTGARSRGTDGESEGVQRDGIRVGNAITLYTGLLDDASDNGALAVVVHEMGHALGLVHRNDRDSVMNAETDDRTDPVPDAVDFYNLTAIYGAVQSEG
ncbi:matrixin family metalloprotease [Pseudonocardia bannensis]